MTDIVKQGYVRFQSKNLGIWKKRWLVLKMHSKKGPVRLEKYDDENDTAAPKFRMIDLSKIENIYRVPDCEKKHAIHITLNLVESVQFCLDSELEAESWLKMIQGEIQGAHHNRDSFEVYLMKHPKLPTHGECIMEVTGGVIRLLNHRDQEIIAWPLNKLRKYGVERNMFTIEAGRSCPTGEGIFVFESEEAEDIYSRVHNVTKSKALEKKNELQSQNASQTSNANNGSSSSNSRSVNYTPVSRSSEDNTNWGDRPSLKELSERPKNERGKANDYAMFKDDKGKKSNFGSRGRDADDGVDGDESEYTEIPTRRF